MLQLCSVSYGITSGELGAHSREQDIASRPMYIDVDLHIWIEAAELHFRVYHQGRQVAFTTAQFDPSETPNKNKSRAARPLRAGPLPGVAEKVPVSKDASKSIAVPIAQVSLACIQTFRQILDSMALPGRDHDFARLRTNLLESRGRFKVWCGNLGAHKTDNSSLDYRLRDAPRTKASVLALIKDLDELLRFGMMFALPFRTPK